MSLRRTTAVDHVVPATVIRDLKAQIIDATTTDSGTYWYSLDAKPRLVFEQAIQHLRSFVASAHEFVGAEWWFRATTTDTGFPFHFDRDEGIRDKIVSPAVASILYLSNAGGPTIVVDAAPSRRTAPRAAIAVHPRPGRFVMFPGELLHGVVPGPATRWPRVTLLVNWWRSVPTLERATTKLASNLAVGRWRAEVAPVTLAPFDPTLLLAKAAWRDLIYKQATYR